MFENIIESESKRLLSIIGEENDVLIQSIIDNCSLNRSYNVYFQAEMDWKIYEEKKVISKDPANAGLSPLTDIDILLEGLYRTKAKYRAGEIALETTKAVSLRLNYLCRPCHTLTWFIFRGTQSITWNEILIRLGAFDEYSNLRGLIIAHGKDEGFADEGSNGVSREEFVKLIDDARRRTDKEIDQVVIELEPLFEYFEEQGYHESVPSDALMLYFDDMGDSEKTELLNNLNDRNITRDMLAGLMLIAADDIIETSEENFTDEDISKADEIGKEIAEIANPAELVEFENEKESASEDITNTLDDDDDDDGVEFVGIADLPAELLSNVHIIEEENNIAEIITREEGKNAKPKSEPMDEAIMAELNREFIKLRNRATKNNVIVELEHIDLPSKDHKDWGRIDLKGIAESVSRLNELLEMFDDSKVVPEIKTEVDEISENKNDLEEYI